MVESVAGYLKYRVVNRITGAEIISDLPHLHQSKWEIRAMTPGGTAGAALSKFTIPLPPPGSALYDKNASTLVQLWPGSGEGYRVEAYLGDVFSSTPRYAGVITNVTLDTANGGTFTLEGYSDPWVLAMQRFFPGELTSNDATAHNSMDRFQRYLAENVLGWYDKFNPYNAANYLNFLYESTNTIQTHGSESWSGTTDTNGVCSTVVFGNVIATIITSGGQYENTNTYGSLTSQTGRAATNDSDHTHYVEAFFRVKGDESGERTGPSVTLGLTSTPTVNPIQAAPSTFVSVGSASVYLFGGAACNGGPSPTSTYLSSIKDEDGYYTLQLSLVITDWQISAYVNGALISSTTGSYNIGTQTLYPYIILMTDAQGSFRPAIPAQFQVSAYVTNLIHGTRNTYKAQGASAPFLAGTLLSATRSQGRGLPQSPTALDALTAIANLEGAYWRYTPVRMASGTHPPMGTFDCMAAPGVDRSKGSSAGKNVVFEAGQNLESIRIQGNADTFASDLQYNGAPSNSSGGQFYVRNPDSISKWGWLTDTSLSLTTTEFFSFYRSGQNQGNNKVVPGGSFTAKVRRDPDTADVWRELDYVTVHEPLLGLYYAKMLVVAYTFTEGAHEMDVTFGQYGIHDIASSSKRVTEGVRHMAGKFANR